MTNMFGVSPSKFSKYLKNSKSWGTQNNDQDCPNKMNGLVFQYRNDTDGMANTVELQCLEHLWDHEN